MSKWDNVTLNQYSLNSLPDLRGTRILFAMGSLSISGGSNLIFQYAAALKQAGATVFIGFMLGKEEDINWHPLASEFTVAPLGTYVKESFDLGIATWWRTVSPVAQIQCARYLYFVQALESKFELDFGDRLSESLAAATYFANMPMVTVSSWLQNLLIAKTGIPVWFVKNGIDKKLFRKEQTIPIRQGEKENQLTLLVEGSLGVGRKAVEEAIQLSVDSAVGEVWHVSPDKGGASNFATRKFEKVSYKDMPKIYQQVDVLVKVSRHEGMFGPPLEAFHCGSTALVSKVSGYDEYIRDGLNSLVIEEDDFLSAGELLQHLSRDRELLARLKEGALETARSWPSIHETAVNFATVCFTVLSSTKMTLPSTANIEDLNNLLKDRFSKGLDPAEILPTPLTTL